jgi:hypothetical protein
MASAAFVSVPAGLIPQDAKAQTVRRRVGGRVPVAVRELAPYWEIVLGPQFADGHLRGFAGAGVTVQQPLGPQTVWGVHAQGGISYGENRFDQTDHEATLQGVLFARNPMVGEIGLFAGLTNFSDQFRDTTTTFGVEGEYYVTDRVTLGGAVGVQSDNESHWVAQGGVSVYPTDNFKLTASALFEQHGAVGAAIGAEYRPVGGFFYIPGSDTNLFAKATFTEDVTAIRGGLRISWGGNGSSLLQADRYQRKNFYGSIFGSEGISPLDNLPFK